MHGTTKPSEILAFTSRQLPESRSWNAFALVLYSATSLIIIDHGKSITKNLLGGGSDVFLANWFLAWWPWAILHHLNPLFTRLVWQPGGLHIAWTTCIPLLALFGLPITLLSGTVPAYNLLTLAAPPLAAYAAYRLCLRFTGAPVAAVIGGFLFGFSSYETTETMSALNLDFIVFIPCVLIVAFDRLTGRINRRRAACLIGVLLAAQFYVSTEILASFCVFGALAWCIAITIMPERRGALRMLCLDILYALPLALILTSPLLLPMLLGPRDVGVSRAWAIEWAAEPFNLLVPSETQLTYTPGSPGFNHGLFGLLPQSDVTTGLPILIILCLFAARNWPVRDIRFLYLTLFVILAASLGPFLWFHGRLTYIPLPWLLALALPLINGALPVRFTLYGTLVTALVVALWIAQGRPGRKPLRVGLGILACILPLPPPHPTMPAPDLQFFAPGRLEAALGGPARLIILPQGNLDMSTFWQAQNNFGFAQTQGYLGMPPNSMLRYAAVRDFITPARPAHFAADFKTLCLATGTQYVIAGPQTTPYLLQAVQTLDWPARRIDDVTVFTAPAHG